MATKPGGLTATGGATGSGTTAAGSVSAGRQAAKTKPEVEKSLAVEVQGWLLPVCPDPTWLPS